MKYFSLGCSANSNPDDTRDECVEIFGKAKKTIKIIAGDIDAGFYRDEVVINSLKKAAGKGVVVEIATDTEKVTRKEPIFGIKNVKVWKIGEPVERHKMSIDGKIARIEQSHLKGSTMTPAIICKDVSILAQEMDANFDRLVKTAVK